MASNKWKDALAGEVMEELALFLTSPTRAGSEVFCPGSAGLLVAASIILVGICSLGMS